MVYSNLRQKLYWRKALLFNKQSSEIVLGESVVVKGGVYIVVWIGKIGDDIEGNLQYGARAVLIVYKCIEDMVDDIAITIEHRVVETNDTRCGEPLASQLHYFT